MGDHCGDMGMGACCRGSCMDMHDAHAQAAAFVAHQAMPHVHAHMCMVSIHHCTLCLCNANIGCMQDGAPPATPEHLVFEYEQDMVLSKIENHDFQMDLPMSSGFVPHCSQGLPILGSWYEYGMITSSAD